MASQLARQLGPRGGHWGYTQKVIYIHTHTVQSATKNTQENVAPSEN